MYRERSPYLVSAEVAQLVGVTQRTLESWIRDNKIETPEYLEDGRRYKWRPEHITEIRLRIRRGELKVKGNRRRIGMDIVPIPMPERKAS